MVLHMLCKLWRRLNFFIPLRTTILLFILFFLIIFPILGWLGALQYSSHFQPRDPHYAEYLVRNRAVERLKQATAYFRLMQKRNLLPYHYPASSIQLALNTSAAFKVLETSSSLSSPRHLSIVIMAHNRNTHEIDAYEPHYLTQTVHGLLLALESDVLQYGPRWTNITVRLCNVDPHPRECRECEKIHFDVLAGKEKTRWNFVEHMAGKEEIEKLVADRKDPKHANCLNQRQFAYCLSKAAEVDPRNYVILLEDDMVARRDALRAIWETIDSIGRRFSVHKSSSNGPERLGLIHLYSPMHHLSYSFSDISSYLELLVIGGGMSVIALLIYFRVYLRPIHLIYNTIFLCSLFTVCVTFVILVGRPHWLQAYHAMTRYYHIGKPIAEEISSVLMTNEAASALASYLSQRPCSWKEDGFSKHQTIHQYLNANGKQVLALYPSAFQHVGLYSSFQRGTLLTHQLDD